MTAGRLVGRAVLLVLRLVTAGLFIWAASVKLANPVKFLFSIKGFEVLPEHMLEPLTFMVPWIELVCAAALLLGFWARPAAIVIGGMLLVFVGAILSVLIRGMSVDCGCFGDFSFMCKPGAVGWCNIGQNALLFAIATPVMLWGGGVLSVDSLVAWCSQRGCDAGSCGCRAGSVAADVDSARARS
jgi:uncharacterized membrane protein YphA (DoxX/SURF4 family)